MRDWAIPVLARFDSYLLDVRAILDLSVRGMETLIREPTMEKFFFDFCKDLSELITTGAEQGHIVVPNEEHQDFGNALIVMREFLSRAAHLPEPYQQHLASIEELAERSRAELERDFPMLHAHSAVALWGAIEVLVDDLIVGWLSQEPNALATITGLDHAAKLRRLALPLRAYLPIFEANDRDAFARELLKEIKSLSRGNPDDSNQTARLENLLKYVQLGQIVGSPGTCVDADTWKALHELGCVRHSIVHRSGVCDAPFMRKCDYTRWSLGERIEITASDYLRYHKAARHYGSVLKARIDNHAGFSTV